MAGKNDKKYYILRKDVVGIERLKKLGLRTLGYDVNFNAMMGSIYFMNPPEYDSPEECSLTSVDNGAKSITCKKEDLYPLDQKEFQLLVAILSNNDRMSTYKSSVFKKIKEAKEGDLAATGIFKNENVIGIVRYVGPVKNTRGYMFGLQLRGPFGNNNGTFGGKKYFDCCENYGTFVSANEIINVITMEKGVDIEENVPKQEEHKEQIELTIGMMVEVVEESTPTYGVVRWIGDVIINERMKYIAGLELEDYCKLATSDGVFQGQRYFTCPAGKGLFVRAKTCQPDRRFCYPNVDSQTKIELERNTPQASLIATGVSSNKKYYILRKDLIGTKKQKKLGLSERREDVNFNAITGSIYYLKDPSDDSQKKCTFTSVDDEWKSITCGKDALYPLEPKEFQLLIAIRSCLDRMSTYKSPVFKKIKEAKEGDLAATDREHVVGIVRYVGPVNNTRGFMFGLQFKESIGDSDGTIDGEKYFGCCENYGKFFAANKITNVIKQQEATHDKENAQEITCPVCNNIPKDAVEASCCRGMFCEQCSDVIVVCPNCRSIRMSFKPNHIVRQLVLTYQDEAAKGNTGIEDPDNQHVELTIGMMVEFVYEGTPIYGVVRWLGDVLIMDRLRYIAGLELEDFSRFATSDGVFQGQRYFTCPAGKGLFVSAKTCNPDRRFLDTIPCNQTKMVNKDTNGMVRNNDVVNEPSQNEFKNKPSKKEGNTKPAMEETKNRQEKNDVTNETANKEVNNEIMEKVENDFGCPICLDFAEDAVEASCCHKIYCEKCVLGQKICPMCRANPFGFAPSHFARQFIGNLKTSCPIEGCDEQPTRSNLQYHLKKCEFQLVKCQSLYCDVSVLRRHLPKHALECDYRRMDCENPGCFSSFSAYGAAQHKQECLFTPVECQNAGCGALMFRKDVETHLKVDCRFEVVVCPAPDCSFRDTSANVGYHLVDAHFQYFKKKNFMNTV